MTQTELEELIRLITVEVVKALGPVSQRESTAKTSPPAATCELEGRESPSACSCADCSCGETGCCCKQNERAFTFDKKVLCVSDIEQLENTGTGRVLLSSQTIITPLAAEVAKEKQIILVLSEHASRPDPKPASGKNLVILCQTSSQSQQQAVINIAEVTGYSAHCEKAPGTTAGSVLKAAVRGAESVARGEVDRLIVLDENVYPLSVQLKRVSGINPKICWDRETAAQSRDHNVLLLNTRMLGIPSLKKITEAWLH